MLTGPILVKPEEDPLAAYLRSKQPIDLDAYLHDKMIEAKARGVRPIDSFGRGMVQGETMGFGDEATGAVQAVGGRILPESLGGFGPEHKTSLAQDYRLNRDTERIDNEAANRANPKTYLGGELAGSVLPTAAAGGATGTLTAPAVARTGLRRLLPMAVAAGQGIVQGAGYSNADTARGVAGDSALGGGLGLAGYGAGQAVDKVVGGASSLATRLRAGAAARAGTQAAEEEGGKVASLAGRLGGETQKGNRIVENLVRQETPLDPVQQQAATALLDKLGSSNLQALPGQASTIAAREAELRAAQQALPQAVAARTAELSKPQFGKDALSFAKSYGEPLAAAAIVDRLSAAVGLDPKTRAMLDIAAGTIFGRTRAGKALMSRLTRPGNVIGMANAGDVTAQGAGALLKQLLQRAAPPIATRQLVEQP